MSKIIGLTGDGAIAYAVKQSNVDVVAAYPITPQTIIVEEFSEFVHNGEVNTEFVCVESEHSAMSACVGASLTGARVFTATASQGLALMHEILYVASSLRCPIIMGVVNRALSAPINIHCDHSDMMGSRDCGWIQIFAENAQEAYDWTIQSFKIAEDEKIQLPITVNIDGFILSHSLEGVEISQNEEVKDFVSTRKPLFKVDPEKPITVGALCLADYYFETKRQQVEALKETPKVIEKVNKEYESLTGRRYSFIDTYGLEDADAAILCLGSTAGTAKAVAKKLINQNMKVGIIKPWLYRPFPIKEIMRKVENLKALAVLDRACSFGAPYGALCSDITTALYQNNIDLNVFNIIYGLGGRDMTPFDIELIFKEALEVADSGKIKEPVKYVGVRE
jgi:pyruvate ferredoxin oxidoreductase alpha subunit